MFIRKKEYEELKSKVRYAADDIDSLKELAKTWEDSHHKLLDDVKCKNEENEELKKQNEELQHKIDILYAYYDIQKEPTQEERTKIRLDMRVHELEMENLELRGTVNLYLFSLRSELDQAYLRSLNYIRRVPVSCYQTSDGIAPLILINRSHHKQASL